MIVLRPQAESDIRTIQSYYEQIKFELGQRFLSEIEVMFDRLLAFPEMYQARRHGVRFALLRVFPYIVSYQFDGTDVWILGIIHEKRHSRVWKSRL